MAVVNETPTNLERNPIFNPPFHANRLVSRKHRTNLLRDDEYADFKLSCDKQIISVHKCLLSSVSGYFRGLFSSKLQEERAGLLKVSTEDASIMPKLIDFLYTGRIETLQGLAVKAVIGTAHKYDFQCVINSSIDYLISDSQPWMALDGLQMGEVYKIPELTRYATKMAARFFNQIVADSEFKALDPEAFKAILNHKYLTGDASDHLDALTVWVKEDTVNRVDHLPELLSNIDLCNMSLAQILERTKDDIFKMRQDCGLVINIAMTIIYAYPERLTSTSGQIYRAALARYKSL